MQEEINAGNASIVEDVASEMETYCTDLSVVPYIKEIDTWYKTMKFKNTKASEPTTESFTDENPYEGKEYNSILDEWGEDYEVKISKIEKETVSVGQPVVEDNTAVIRILLKPENYTKKSQIEAALAENQKGIKELENEELAKQLWEFVKAINKQRWL